MSERQNRRKKEEKRREKERKRKARIEAERTKSELEPKADNNSSAKVQLVSPQKNSTSDAETEPKTNDKAISDKNEHLAQIQDKRRVPMDNATYLFATLGAIFAVASGVLIGVIHYRDSGVWVGCAAVIAFVISGAAYLQGKLWQSDEAVANTRQSPTQQQGPQRILELPTFRQSPQKVTVSLGGISAGYSLEQLTRQPQFPFNFGGFQPIRFYVEGNRPYADVMLFAGLGRHPIELKHNELVNKPPHWDMNSNQTAMEIVNEDQVPVFQLIYKDSAHIVINGIFPTPAGGEIADGSKFIHCADIRKLQEYRINRLFKYPAWKHPGEYETH